MKRTIFAIAVAAMAFAIDASAQFSVGVGYANELVVNKKVTTLPNGTTGSDWRKNRTYVNGFYVEAAYNWEFATVGPGAFALQPGIRYYCLSSLVNKTYSDIKFSIDGLDIHEKSQGTVRMSDNLIDIPVNIKYSYDFVPEMLKGYVFAGPAFSFGIASNSVSTSSNNITIGDRTIEYKDINRINCFTGKYYNKTYNNETGKSDVEKGKDDIYKTSEMFDLKLAIGIGITVAEKVNIKVGYNFGLLNRSSDNTHNNSGDTTHSNILHFGAAYNF